MQALALENLSLSTSEQSLKECILENILEDFCKDCPALRYEFDTGSWDCPCGDDPESNDCYRSQEWAFINEEADSFISNIRTYW